ncbi:MAG TPA: hypothetical protein DIT29_01710 [Pseudothermotoga sp.]|uniref:hypothetical protein n=1 Tax=Pseudothermotoga sp. TaxID=2033661 RepID=UPI000E884E32|nr:hypothetical protein [Pseudothermotoga sp.]HCO97423.1 hypothetical protein [Pseudothermotoga sp.]
MIEVSVYWKFAEPTLIDENTVYEIEDSLRRKNLKLFSFSDFIAKRVYSSAFGYTVIGDALLKIRLRTENVGSVLRGILKLSVHGSMPVFADVSNLKPSNAGYLVLESSFGNLDAERLVRECYESYSKICLEVFDEDPQSLNLVPVFTKVTENLFRVDLFGSDRMIELWNLIGFRLHDYRSFFYHQEDVPILNGICKKLRRKYR